MVRILSNGDIVPDDDPRASQASSRGGNSSRPQPRQGYVRHDEDAQQGMNGQQVSIFDSLNQRLLAAGIPRFNVGQMTVEPIVSVGFCLAGLLLGVKGLLFGAVLFFVAKMSTGNGIPGFGAFGEGGGQGGGGGQRQGRGRGSGQRLGR
ncbi:protein FAM241B-like [Haliotis rubra]|uniref:protein FAM241B-like n=1 Tax=Haliotis rubra TaxID=36100 RepID=UPI001EE5B701|nr:protein FAM241B-like [Haliotis rubra]